MSKAEVMSEFSRVRDSFASSLMIDVMSRDPPTWIEDKLFLRLPIPNYCALTRNNYQFPPSVEHNWNV